MISSQRSPLWPYLLVLSALFLLSLAVPRGWQQESGDDWHPLERRRAQIRRRMSTDSIAIVRPSSENLALPETWQSANETANHDHWTGQQLADDLNGSSSNFIAPLAETVAKKIADFRRFRAMQSGADGSNGGDLQEPFRPWTAEQKSSAIASAYWPVPNSLLAQLNKLAADSECQPWAQRVENLCLQLCQASPGDLKQSEAIVQQLESLEQEAGTLDHTLQNDKTASEFRRVHYALRRRLALWSAAFSAQQQSEVYANVPSTDVQRQRLGDALKAADDWVQSLSYADAWRKYLMLEELHQLTDANNTITSEQSQRLARQALARMLPAQMDDQQRRILGDRTIQEVADQLRWWANESSDVREVLANIEQYESSGLPSDAKRVAVGLRKLNWSASQQDRQMAHQLDEHYRNANIRIAMTNDFLNRLAPSQPVANGVVNDTILGAWVNGSSTTNSKLSVKFIPDPKRLHFWIDTAGTVDSSTTSTSGPATFSHDGSSNFLVHKAVILDEHGLGIAKAVAETSGYTQLTGVHTEYDGMPLVGSIARNIAISQHDSMRGAAQQVTDERVATQAIQSVDTEVKQHLTEAEQAVRKNLYDPLAKLGVAPEPVSLETSRQRLTMRLRIAGQNQLGGHTARPQALSDSLASMQIHESALNNILDKLDLAGRTFGLAELYRFVAEQLGRPQLEPPVDLPTNVQVTFAANDPVRLRCHDGVVSLTLAVARLQQNVQQWNNFQVTVNYEPQVEDLHVRLVRQGAVELSGEAKGQAELALRGIFSKLFPRERGFELVPKAIADNRNLGDMTISQCVVEDGWIAISLGPDRDNGNRTTMRDSADQR